MSVVRLGGLFSGIGGFELAWQRSGGTVAWMCEIDPAARRVLEARFSGVPIYRDISTLDPNELAPVDVLTGGSPCQGFSVAGARTGLEHAESRLFADYVRILEGLETRGLSWAVWENVPGVLSITDDDGERTFEHVVAALVGADEPVRLDRRVRWNSGLAARGSRGLAWRVLDSRHFGVPQRRRRVYACVALGRAPADRAYRALLALPESLSRDPATCGQTRQATAGAATGGAGGGVARGLTSHRRLFDDRFVPDVAHTLRAAGHDASEDGTGRGTPLVAEAFDARQAHVLAYGEQAGPLDTDGHSVAVLLRNREGRDGGGKGPLLIHDESLTLATGNDQVLFAPVPLKAAGSHGSSRAGNGRPNDPARTPDATGVEPVAAPFAFDTQQITSLANRTRVGPDEPVSTLAATSTMHAATAYGPTAHPGRV